MFCPHYSLLPYPPSIFHIQSSSLLSLSMCPLYISLDMTLPLLCWGSLTQPPGSATGEEKDYQDMICLGRKGGQSLKGEGP